MTRGKYATRAASRRETTEVEATEAGYRRQIVRLTQERDEAREALATTRKAHATEARILRAQVAEGTSVRVEALTRELERVRAERDRMRAERANHERDNGAQVKRMAEHFVHEHGIAAGPPALEAVFQLVTGTDTVIMGTGEERRIGGRYGAEVIKQLRAARGQA